MIHSGSLKGVSRDAMQMVLCLFDVQALDLISSFLAAHGQGPQRVASTDAPCHTQRTLQVGPARIRLIKSALSNFDD